MKRKKNISPEQLAELNEDYIGPDSFAKEIESQLVGPQTIGESTAHENITEINAEVADIALAVGLLSGVWTQQGSKPSKDEADKVPAKRYFEGELEKQGREAIGRLLRSNKPLDSNVRLLLAELFDGLPPHSSFDGEPMARKIIFYRGAGNPKEIALRDVHLVADYWDLRVNGDDENDHKPMVHQKALNKICKKYDVSTTVVKDARRRDKRLDDRLKAWAAKSARGG